MLSLASCLATLFCLFGLNAYMTATFLTRTSVIKWIYKRETDECSGSEYFLCKTGECLSKYQLCDSVVDCKDKSDELAPVCLALYKGRCRRGQWRCAYGACVSESKHCDQNKDCWDGSDESDCPQLSTSTEPEPTTTTETQPPVPSNNSCEVPNTNNTLFFTWESGPIPKEPGSLVEHNDLLLLSCDVERKFSVEGGRKTFTLCNNGEWEPKIPKCTTCGISSLGTNTTLPSLNAEDAEQDNFPWHAGLYYWNNNQWKLICGGTLITNRVVLTGAHCISLKPADSNIPYTIAVEDLSLSLGKFNCDWNNMEDLEQRFDVKELVLHPDYHSGTSSETADVGLVLLDRDVELNAFVMPACVDYTNTYTVEVATNKSLRGQTAGWNVTWTAPEWQCLIRDGSDALLYSNLPIINYQDVYDMVEATKKSFTQYLYEDLFVVTNGTAADLFIGDYGSGLTIPFKGRHYVFGIFVNYWNFNRNRYGAFINVSQHTQWLKTTVDMLSQKES